ncbi:MAG: hypothetical protein R3A11_04340 [Bdellovibrionota bacterium]
MKFLRCLVPLGLILALGGCEHARLSLGGNPTTPYHKELSRQTRAEKLYGLEEVLYQTEVSLFSQKLRDQYIEEYLRVFAPEEAEAQAFRKENMEDQTNYTEFVVTHFTSRADSINLKASEHKKVWDFFLYEDQDKEGIRPLSVEIIPKNTRTRYFYPQASSWSKIYKLRFPKSHASNLHLQMFGPVRTLDFYWKKVGV